MKLSRKDIRELENKAKQNAKNIKAMNLGASELTEFNTLKWDAEHNRLHPSKIERYNELARMLGRNEFVLREEKPKNVERSNME